MSQVRRRFSLHQRSKKVTIGPLGFDVPIKSDPTAFPHDDQVDAEDQLSDVDYSNAGPERDAKRRRIEDHARDYLCGRPLDIYTASLRGPVTKSYWGESAAVTGTIWELRASEWKSETLKTERDSRRQMIQRSRQSLSVPGSSQKRISVTWTATKPFATVSKQNEDISISDSQQPTERLLASSPANKIESRILDVEDLPEDATPIPSFSERLNSLKRSQWARDADINHLEPVVPATSPTGNCSNLLDELAMVDDMQMLKSAVPAVQEPGNVRGLLQGEVSANKPSGARRKEQSKPGHTWISKGKDPMVENGDTKPVDITLQSKSALETLIVPKETTIGFDLKMLDQIKSGLESDDTSFFRNSRESQENGSGHSPATALKKSLPKVNTRKSTNLQQPPSPTAQAILRKAIKPTTAVKRGELGNGLSLKEIIAKTNGTSRPNKRPKKLKPIGPPIELETPHLEVNETVAPVEELQPVPAKEAESTAKFEGPDERVVDQDASSNRAAEGDAEGQPEGTDAINGLRDATINPDGDNVADRGPAEVPVPEDSAMETQPETQPPPRLSQMPTPLPPSPLQLLNAAKHGTPNIPETVIEEETPEKHVPVDTSLKENEPAFHPGPRRAKRTAPKPRSARTVDPQPSSNEELKAAITARKIATPISRLHQKMAEFSPVSPMVAPPVSPIPESQPQLDSQKSSIRRQDQLREEQQKGSSQLSSPPPSSPPAEGISTAKEIQPREPVVEVPASSKDAVTAEPIAATDPGFELEPASNGAPLSPPQDHHEEESTIEFSSAQFRKIAESMRNAGPVAIPLGTGETIISYIPASLPEPVDTPAQPSAGTLATGEHPSEIPRLEPIEQQAKERLEPGEKLSDKRQAPTEKKHDDVPTATAETTTEDSIDSQDLDLPPKRKISEPAVLVPETPSMNTQASRVPIPDSFKKAITAPINLALQTPGAPLPPPFVPISTGGFAAHDNDDDVIITSPIDPRATAPTNGDRTMSVTVSSPVNTIEFTPFREIASPRLPTQQSNADDVGDISVHEPTTVMSPFTFSQFMKPVESQYEVSDMVSGKDGGENGQDDRPSSYDFEHVLGGVDDYLMSDVYDVEAEARQLSESQSFGKDAGGKGGLLSNQRTSVRR
ncbi:hypothetical protein TWF694_006730 [Orbilia ellipsospora]|uniref:Uncharacterized protein n=1 Tax=Orbilia ellipsospora TaxID=2528407 RepID=A0AAV9XLD8_9PEZI